MNIFLIVVFLVNGVWTDGTSADGWAPIPMNNMTQCITILAGAEKITVAKGNSDVIKFRCEQRKKLLTSTPKNGILEL